MTLRDKVATVDMVDPDSVFNCYVQLEKPLAVKNARLALISQSWSRLMAAPIRQSESIKALQYSGSFGAISPSCRITINTRRTEFAKKTAVRFVTEY